MRYLFIATILTVGTSARADDWPQWLGPQRDGVWRETGIVESFPAGGPKQLWRTELGAGYSGPAVAGGKVFVTDRLTPDGKFSREGTERVLCLDQQSGKVLWKFEYAADYGRLSYPSGPRCTPTVAGNRVYTLGAVGDLHAIDIATGKSVWSKSFTRDYKAAVPIWGFAAHPLIDGDKLICLGGGAGKLVVAFDTNTGRELWATETCEGDFGYSPPMIYEFGGRRQLIIWHSRAVLGLDPETGKRLWRVDFPVKAALTAPTPRKVGDDGLLVTSFYNGSMLLKVGATSAEVVWQSKSTGERPGQTADLSSIIPTAVIVGDHVFGVCSYGQLRCLEVKTGKRVWETMKATRGARTPESVAAKDEPDNGERWSNAFLTPVGSDRYFLFNEQGDLIIAKLTPAGYEEIARAHIIEPTNPQATGGRKVVWVHPAYAGKCLFVRNDKEIICVSLAK